MKLNGFDLCGEERIERTNDRLKAVDNDALRLRAM